jgi:putative colanic acid biosynthesis glycosyltransferase WcaI
MKVLLLNQFFHPDIAPTAQIATELAEDLVRNGIQITALASRGSYLGGAKLPSRASYRGIDIVRLGATSFGKRTSMHRAMDYASFCASAALKLSTLPRHDALIVLTTPPLIAGIALIAKGLKGTPLVHWVQDLYPDVAVAFGALAPRSLATRGMQAISRAVMRRADAVVALGKEMRDRCVAAGAAPERTFVVPNWSDPASLQPVPHHANSLRSVLANGARTLVMYSGNMGRAHDVATLLAAARLLRGRPDIVFVYAGEGAKRADVECAARELPNVRLVPYQPRERLSESLSAADVHLIALSPEIEGLIEPSKLYGVMAVGRPAVFVGPPKSEVARTIEHERCGCVIANGDAEGVAAAVRMMADDPLEREAMGTRAREALELRYSRSIATDRFRGILLSLSAGHAPHTSSERC